MKEKEFERTKKDLDNMKQFFNSIHADEQKQTEIEKPQQLTAVEEEIHEEEKPTESFADAMDNPNLTDVEIMTNNLAKSLQQHKMNVEKIQR